MSSKSKSVTPGRLLTNACYAFVVLAVALVIAWLVGVVVGWIVPADTFISARGDLSHNYYVAYSIRGSAILLVFFVAMYFLSRTHGYRVAFSLREHMTTADFVIETFLALVVFEAVTYWIMRESLASWYLSGTLAAVFGIIDPSDIYSLSFGGTGLESDFTIQNIAIFYYLWLQILLDVVIAVASVFVLRKGRLAGEVAAQKAHEQQLAEMRRESGLDK